LLAGQKHLLSLGITGWQDAHAHPPILEAYRAGAAGGDLQARVVAALHWDPSAGLDQIPALIEARASVPGGRLRADAVKLFLDGVIESGTAYLLDPYLAADGSPTSNRGLPNFNDGALASAVVELDRRGFQVHFHAIGDAAIRQALDAVAAAREANGMTGNRHHIAHLECIHPDDVPRFARLGVTATIQPLWAVHEAQMERLRLPVLGEPRSNWQFPFSDLERAGARLAAGSDWNVSSANPLEEIEVAIRRAQTRDRAAEAFLPDQRLSLDSALAAFTSGSAWVNRWETDAGSIEVGKAADLAILDRNLRAAGYPSEARVVETLIGGETVYAV
jgi:predicted amidohydrolase YtcJ